MQTKNLLLVTYTLYPPAQDEDLVSKLEKADSYELDETAWLVCTPDTAAYWYSQLERLIFDDDELTVLRVSVHDVSTADGLKEDLEQWLKSRFG